MRAILLALLVAGCAAPEVRYQTVNVPTPVVVACVVQVPEEPKWAVDALPADADDFELAKAYRVERRQRAQYNRELQAAMAACKKGTP
jgi:hypothetical protein